MRIIVDCMSGDNAPAELVNGALSAADTSGVSLTLVGQPEAVQAIVQASGHSLPSDCISIYPSSSIITMQDDPIASVQKRDPLQITLTSEDVFVLGMIRLGERKGWK